MRTRSKRDDSGTYVTGCRVCDPDWRLAGGPKGVHFVCDECVTVARRHHDIEYNVRPHTPHRSDETVQAMRRLKFELNEAVSAIDPFAGPQRSEMKYVNFLKDELAKLRYIELGEATARYFAQKAASLNIKAGYFTGQLRPGGRKMTWGCGPHVHEATRTSHDFNPAVPVQSPHHEVLKEQ